MAAAPPRLRVATRGSALARWQAERVIALIGEPAELVIVSTMGDERTDTPIHTMGGTGVFVKEVQQALLEGRADLAVHSAKDLPPERNPEIATAFVERGDPRDALVGSTLADLPSGAIVGTGSVRRRAQLAALRPDLGFAELRGNIDTRLRKASQFDAIVVAAAALDRLGLSDAITERIDPSSMLPQVGQGALALEWRMDEERLPLWQKLNMLGASDVGLAVDAERAFLERLGGGCSLPCGALATVHGDEVEVEIDGVLASLDGRIVLRDRVVGDGSSAGAELARRLLDDHGGRALLEEVA
jgi:hydroxymethylbilane synthase